MKNKTLKGLVSKTFHFIGIGGISMSALAQMLKSFGFKVQGSDIQKNDETEKLVKRGINVFYSQVAENLMGDEVVVYTSAIGSDNEEFRRAKELGLKTIKRAELLGMICEEYKTVIAVAGSHGKTTTTAMIAEIFLNAKRKPTVHIGGELKSINSNFFLGNKNFFITEACEYKDNYLFIKPDIAVILNVDSDHLDYFGSLGGVKKSFLKFSQNLKEGGICVVSDEKDTKFLRAGQDKVCFGLKRSADIYAKNIREYKPGFFKFDCFLCEIKLGQIELNIIGKHNIKNALVSIFVSLVCGIDFCDIKFALENFSGVQRRCERVGQVNGAEVYHDYAHHPEQIKKMIEVAKHLVKGGGKIITVFEPHTYSRTKFLLEDFAVSFAGSGYLILAPVYSAREDESQGKNSLDLALACEAFVKNVEYYETYAEILKRILHLARSGDVVLILGAGSIEKLSKMIKSEVLCET